MKNWSDNKLEERVNTKGLNETLFKNCRNFI